MVRNAQSDNLDRATRALDHACQAVADQKSANGLSEKERHWDTFLIQWNRSLRFLMKAARPGSTKQFGDRLRHIVRTDPALKYLLHARNCSEHVGYVTGENPSQLRIGPAGGPALFSISGDGIVHVEGCQVLSDADGEARAIPDVHAEVRGNELRAVTSSPDGISFEEGFVFPIDVTDRGGEYPNPVAHLPRAQQCRDLAATGIRFLDDNISTLRQLFADQE